MKIAIDARMYGLENAGIGRYVVNLIDQIAKVDKQNTYVLLLNSNYFNKLKLPQNFSQVLADFKHYSLAEQLKLPKIIAKINPDITHFLHFNVPLTFKGKFIVTIHDLLMHKQKGQDATTLNPISYKIKRLGYHKVFTHAVMASQKIIAPSKFVKDEILKTYKVPEDKIEVIYEGVNFN